MPTQDFQLTFDQRLALSAIFHHELAKHPTRGHGDHLVSINEGRAQNDQLSRQQLQNFLQKAAPDGSGKIYDYFRLIVANDQYYASALSHIKAAIKLAYEFRPLGAPINASLVDVFRLIYDPSLERRNEISRTYEGVWSIFRYSGHREKDSKKDTDDPFVLRSAIRIFPRDMSIDESLPKFEVRYRPDGMPQSDYGTGKGSIVPLTRSNHIIFVGAETDAHHLVEIVCGQEARGIHEPQLTRFVGLLRRNHEQGRIMVATALFLRCPEGSSLDSVTPKLGMFRQNVLARRLSKEYPDGTAADIFRLFVNRIPNQGTGALLL